MHAVWSLTAALSLGVGLLVIAAERIADAEEIPLEECWGFKMAYMRDVQKLDPRTRVEDTLIIKLQNALYAHGKKVKAGPCFLVQGIEKEALTNAAKVLIDGEKPQRIEPGTPTSLVFYSHPAPGYVFIESIDRTKNHIAIKYYVKIHLTAEVTVHFALIPLGKLEPGKYTVDIIQVGDEKYDWAKADEAVCDSGTLTVEGNPK
jgi:hypothetical protein